MVYWIILPTRKEINYCPLCEFQKTCRYNGIASGVLSGSSGYEKFIVCPIILWCLKLVVKPILVISLLENPALMEDSWVQRFTNQPTTKDMNVHDFQRAKIRAFQMKNSPNNQFSGSILSFGGVHPFPVQYA